VCYLATLTPVLAVRNPCFLGYKTFMCNIRKHLSALKWNAYWYSFSMWHIGACDMLGIVITYLVKMYRNYRDIRYDGVIQNGIPEEKFDLEINAL
jgi:hypothetical protein